MYFNGSVEVGKGCGARGEEYEVVAERFEGLGVAAGDYWGNC